MKLYSIAVMLIWIAVAAGCSGAPANPIQPDKPANIALSVSVDTQRQLWGMWDISIDLERLSAMVTSASRVENHFNVLPFLTPPNCFDCLMLQINSFDAVTGILDLDVTLRNKFMVNGYDVRGIVFTDDLGHLLKNEDAWTALYDVPGGDTINPFIAYGKDKPQRQFPGDGQLTENFQIWVPDPPKFALIKYAVDASYPGNCEEPYSIENFAQEEITSEVGSHGTVSVDIKDWQGDVDSVSIYAPDLNDDALVLAHQSGDTWSGDFTNSNAATAGDYGIKITAMSTGSGATGLYFLTRITVSVPGGQNGWARTWGGSSVDQGVDVATDGSGNIYVIGGYQGTVDFDPGAGVDEHISNGSSDIFLSKFDSSGNFIWARTWGGGGGDGGLGIDASGSGDVLVTGIFSGIVDFDPGPGIENHNGDGAFLSKFDSSGLFLWARTWNASQYGAGNDVALDGLGFACVTGSFAGSVDLDPGSGVDNHFSNGANDIFLSKFDTSGNFNWAVSWGGGGNDGDPNVAMNEFGDVYTTGFFSSTVDFNPGAGVDNHTANGFEDIFLTKLDSSGNFNWARTWGGPEDNSGCSVDADGFGNVYVSGAFSGTADFDPGSGVDNHTSNGNGDIFLSKFDSAGVFSWAYTFGGTENEYGAGVESDGSGNVFLSGIFSGLVDFDPGAGVEKHESNGVVDIFLSKFDISGDFKWARTWGGADYDMVSGISTDAFNNVCVTGWFYGMVDFDPHITGVDNHTSNGFYDVFLSKFLPDGDW